MAKKKSRKKAKGKRGPKTAAGRKRSTAAYVKFMKKQHNKLHKVLEHHDAIDSKGYAR